MPHIGKNGGGLIGPALYRDDVHRDTNENPVLHETNIPFSVAGKHVVLVDDVLFTARTIRAGMDAVMDLELPPGGVPHRCHEFAYKKS